MIFVEGAVFKKKGGLRPDDQPGIGVNSGFAEPDEFLQLGIEGAGNHLFIGIDIGLDDDDLLFWGVDFLAGCCYRGQGYRQNDQGEHGSEGGGGEAFMFDKLPEPSKEQYVDEQYPQTTAAGSGDLVPLYPLRAGGEEV